MAFHCFWDHLTCPTVKLTDTKQGQSLTEWTGESTSHFQGTSLLTEEEKKNRPKMPAPWVLVLQLTASN